MRMLDFEPKEKVETLTSDGGMKLKVAVTVKPLTGMEKTTLLRKFANPDVVSRIEASAWAMQNLIDKLVIDGEKFEGEKLQKLAKMFDAEDEATRLAMKNIIGLAVDAVCLDDDDIKK